MSLLRALRAYVGLGPDEDYEEHYVVDQSRPTVGDRSATGRSQPTRPRGSYLDDYYRKPASGDSDDGDEVIDIRNARIDARRADGSEAPTSRRPNQSRNRVRDRSGREQSLSENEELLDQIAAEPADVYDNVGDPDHVEERSVGHQPEQDSEASEGDIGPTSQGAVVRSIDSARSRPRTLNPESFSDAKHVADEFKRGAPVVINLQGLERDLVRRLVDFASGMCYALDGSMEKLAPQVFLLTPVGQDVSEVDRRRIEERGYAR